MDERKHFLSNNSNKKKKKNKKQHISFLNKNSNKSNVNISIIHIILFFLLILTSMILIIKIINASKNLNEANNQNNMNNNTISYDIDINTIAKKEIDINYFLDQKRKYKRLFLFKEDIIENFNKNQIHISMAIDNNYTYPTLVSMTSILENNNKDKNIIIFHMLLSYNYNKSYIEIFESLKNNYEVKINYYLIPNIFQNLRTWSSQTYTVYFKILLPLILPDLKRIIYIDSDTLTFKDLLEMFILPFNDNYVLGYPFQDVQKIDRFVKNAKTYINGGVLLFNIEKIRKENKDIELLKFTFENNADLWFLEQDSINVVFFQKIGLLPLKYGIYLYGDMKTYENYYEKRLRIKLNKDELKNAMDDPSLVHLSCCNPKVWNKNSRNDFGMTSICDKFRKDFYFYANKTKYYNEIYNKYMK